MRAKELAAKVEQAMTARATAEHLDLLEAQGERALSEGKDARVTGHELLALVGEVRALRKKVVGEAG